MFIRPLVLLMVTVGAMVAALPTAAQSSWLYELRGGVAAHDIPIVAAGRMEYGVAINAEVAFAPSLALFGGNIRPVLGGTFATNNGTSFVYLDARWEWAGPLLFFGFGVGPAIQNGSQLYYSTQDQKALGSRVLFHIPVELGLQVTPQNRISVYYEHVSNGFTAYPNPGMDNIGLRLAHRF
jgi:lipid A 3-O-deacylase